MTPEMQEALYQLSLRFDPDPAVLFQEIVETVARFYDDTKAMITLLDGDYIRCHALAHEDPANAPLHALPLKGTYCQYCMDDLCPVVIQNAEEDPRYRDHPGVAARRRRYLGVPICNPQGAFLGTLCFVDDKIDQILREEDVRFLSLLAMRVSAEMERERIIKAQIAEHQAAMERAAELNAQLLATAEAKRRFVAMVIHDLRHPLTAMQTVCYLLRDEEDFTERGNYMNLLENRIHALTHLLDSLRQYNEIEAGRIRVRVERVHLGERLRQCVEEFAPAFADDQVCFACEVPDDLGEVETDCDKLHHIVLNLLSNALKFTPRGRVLVRANALDEASWFLEVEDTGIGMKPEELSRIFDEFYRAPNADGGSGRSGSGLGLAIVRQFGSVLQAQVTVRSAPGEGTCFRLVFPRVLQVAAERDAESAPS